MRDILFLLAILAILYWFYTSGTSNPEYNCINPEECPTQPALVREQNEKFYRQRTEREADLMLPDGRIELVTHQVANPQTTVRDLYS